jgi:hypothetical protein
VPVVRTQRDRLYVLCALTGQPHRLFWMRSAWWCHDCRQKIESCCEGGGCPSITEVVKPERRAPQPESASPLVTPYSVTTGNRTTRRPPRDSNRVRPAEAQTTRNRAGLRSPSVVELRLHEAIASSVLETARAPIASDRDAERARSAGRLDASFGRTHPLLGSRAARRKL